MADSKPVLAKLEHDPKWVQGSVSRWEKLLHDAERDVSHAHKMIDLRRKQLAELRKEPKPTAPREQASAVVKLAGSFVGARETPPRSNSGPIVDKFTAWGAIGQQSWCGAFVGYVLDHAVGIHIPTEVAVYVPSLRRYIESGDHGFRKVALHDALPGDILIYGFEGYTHSDHTGFMAEVDIHGDEGQFETIEGNTHDDLGGGVYRRADRDGAHVKDIVCVGRPPYVR